MNPSSHAIPPRPPMAWLLFVVIVINAVPTRVRGQGGETLERKLNSVDADVLARESQRRGDPRRGALVFYTSAAACVNCHAVGLDRSPLGPDLARLGPETTEAHVVESLLDPSKTIRKGYETVRVLTDDGAIVTGLVARETESDLILRDASNLDQEITVAKDSIEEQTFSKQSMMPNGLVSSLRSYADFLDLVSYVVAVAKGGNQRATELKPSPDQLLVEDDTQDLDHAGIWESMSRPRDFRRGEQIYNGHCVNCHGADGNKPSLATARAFGKQKLKYGSDPYRMFLTLSRGNGLMAAATHLSPRERYQVVYYIRQRFMMGSNPDYQPVTDKYLDQLPEGSGDGEFEISGDRDFGPALASQLGRDVPSVLTVGLGDQAIAYNLHRMDQQEAWRVTDRYHLDLSETQHFRGRGEGYAEPDGRMLDSLAGWQWAHDGTFDYPMDLVPPRGPLPRKWMEYRGHYLHGNEVVLRYRIDGREILETPFGVPNADAIRHTLRIGPGGELLLSVAHPWPDHPSREDEPDDIVSGVLQGAETIPRKSHGAADGTIAIVAETDDRSLSEFTASMVRGDVKGLTWTVDDMSRLVLRIPASEKSRLIDVTCFAGEGQSDLQQMRSLDPRIEDPASMIHGGPSRWPQRLETTGYWGLEKGAYAVDEITAPDQTPWNTWFRTSALDFFPDGRMVVATIGGDIWIVSGVDEDLINLRWKRFAGGMYEPFGVKVVNGKIHVTCKDRLTRLHDFNGDDEADFYESFSADTDVSTFFHAFNFDLHTDSAGNFYYAKCGQYTDHALPGALIKVSPDGADQSVVCMGFRTPNGLGMLPDDRVTVSDNQGNWIPASKISLVKPDGFYGYVQTHASRGWAPDGGRIDHREVVPPDTFDPPIVWMPQDLDNSSGGQIWVDDDRWGPLSGRLLHTSFGKGWLYSVMMQEVDGVEQAAIAKLPHDFGTGIMRGRVNPHDGQVYVTGMNGWNANGRPGLGDGGVYRVRYTGRPLRALTDCRVVGGGLQLSFNFELAPSAAKDVSSYEATQWNYKWAPSYGSEFYHPETGEVGTQDVAIEGVRLSDDGRTVTLRIPKLKPVDQLRLTIDLEDTTGEPFQDQIHWTIHRVPN